MNILVIGGSNSLLKGGYVAHLERALPAARFHQLSVGATTTLAGIGRLFDSAGRQDVDFILYEYSINDAGHFAWRPDGGRSWLLAFHLLVQAAARLYPNAVLVPLVFAMRRFASPAVPDPFHALQTETFAALRLPFIDMRQWCAGLFVGPTPDWLYGDEAHYAVPHATDLIGSEVARRLLALRGLTQARTETEPLARTWQRMQEISPHGALELAYVPAAGLAGFASGPVQLAQDGNRLLQMTFLRMGPGSRLAMRTEMFPLALYLKSDAQHGGVRVSVDSECLRGSVVAGTRHVATDALRLVCSNLPLPLLFGDALALPFGAAAFAIDVPPAGEAAPANANFDCFGLPAEGHQHYQHFDLCGILFVSRSA